MKRVLSAMIAMMTASLAGATELDATAYRIVPQFPDPAMGASLVLGSNLGNGRLVLWDGDSVYLQEFLFEVGPMLDIIASGLTGDPAFVAVKSNNRTAVLGSGAAGVVYQIDVLNPDNLDTRTQTTVPTHFSGALLNDTLLLLDRVKDDMSGTELVVVDLNARRSADNARMVLSKPLGVDAETRVVDLPPGSQTAAVHVDRGRGRVYAMDAATRELRRFQVSDMVSAFTNGTTLDWQTDGTLIGTPGQFLDGGVAGINPARELIIGGSMGAAMSEGIQFVDETAPATITATLDPALTGGDAPPYIVVYNARLDEVIAIDPTFVPPVVYATETAIPPIPPESPCDSFDDIDTAFASFRNMFVSGSNDIDADGIPDTAMLEMIELFCTRGIDAPLVLSADAAYDLNLQAFDAEASSGALSAFREVIAVLMTMSQAMQNNVRAALDTSGNPLFETYAILTCSDPINPGDPMVCLPEFVEDPDPVLRRARAVVRAANEPYSAQGDPDDDGLTNLQEYLNVMEMGGDDFDFAIAASSDRLDGTSGIRAGGSGGCLIATAAYGTPLAAEIAVLRTLRDQRMMGNPFGTALVDLYYRVSPPLADRVAAEPALANLVRALLYPLIAAARSAGAALMLTIAMFTLAMTAVLVPYCRRGLTRNE
ncbi:MAG: hypothetical protein IID09_00545 [Candidatus Hydrogenedentes bacterium]|nr:hypothetical protein [Candidatus Hydrogenedentota bacterium]